MAVVLKMLIVEDSEDAALLLARELQRGDFDAQFERVETAEVTDTGSGIPEDQISQIFDLFHQVDSSTTRGFEGAGLGLYIVKNNAELLGEEVKVASELGKGSIFAVTLPIRS